MVKIDDEAEESKNLLHCPRFLWQRDCVHLHQPENPSLVVRELGCCSRNEGGNEEPAYSISHLAQITHVSMDLLNLYLQTILNYEEPNIGAQDRHAHLDLVEVWFAALAGIVHLKFSNS